MSKAGVARDSERVSTLGIQNLPFKDANSIAMIYKAIAADIESDLECPCQFTTINKFSSALRNVSLGGNFAAPFLR